MDFVLNNGEVILTSDGNIKKDFREIFSDKDLASTYMLGEVEGSDYPVLLSQGKTLNVTKLYKVFFQMGEKSIDKLSAIYDSKLAKDGVCISDLYKAANLYQSYLQGKLSLTSIEVPTSNYTSASVGDKVSFALGTASVNETSPLLLDPSNRNIPKGPKDFDKSIMFRVPNVAEITATTSMEDLLPSNNDFVPYANPYLGSVTYKNHITSEEELVLVEGESSNNKFELYHEEVLYAETLKALIHDMLNCKSVLTSNLVKQFLVDLGIFAANRNYKHTGFMPDKGDREYGDDEDDDSSLESEMTGIDEYVSLVANDDASAIVAGELAIAGCIDKQFSIDPMGVPNIIIQLFRYGSRKPTRLEFSDGSFFDLLEFRSTSFSGDLSNYAPITSEDGSQLILERVITLNSKQLEKEVYELFDVEISPMNIPIGFVACRVFEGIDSVQRVYFTIEDFINGSKVNDPRVSCDLLKYEDGKLKCHDIESLQTISVEQAVSLVRGSRDGEHVYYSSSDFVERFVAIAKYNAILSRLSCVYDYINTSYLSDTLKAHLCPDDSMISAVSDDLRVPPIQVLKVNMLYSLLSLCVRANDIFVNNTDGYMSDAISSYNTLLQQEEESGPSDDFSLDVMETVDFGEEEEEMKISECLIDSSYRERLGDSKVYCVVATEAQASFLDNKDSLLRVGKDKNLYVIGKFDFNVKGKKGIFLNEKNSDQPQGVLALNNLVSVLMQTFRDIAGDEDVKYKFEDRATVEYYAKVLNTVLKGVMS